MKVRRCLWLLSLLALSACSLGTNKPASSSQESQAPSSVPESTLPAVQSEAASTPNEAFTEYLNEYVIDVCEADYITMHRYFEHPQDFGIDPSKAEISLGSFVPTQEEEDQEYQLKEDLLTFTYTDLDARQQQIYDQLLWQYDLYEASLDETYTYLDNIWSAIDGQQRVLVEFFSEYELRQESDIAPLLTLIEDVPRYVQEALDYTKVQAEKDLLHFDYETVLSSIQTVLDTQKDSAVTSELMLEVEALDLDAAKTEDYQKQITSALQTYYFPAFETMKSGLEALKSQVQDPVPLSSLPGGREYYKLMAQYATGSSEDPAFMKQNMSTMLNTVINEYSDLTQKDPQAAARMENLQTSFTSPQAILEYLQESYQTQFPALQTMHYDLQALADEQSQDGIVAYFLIPPVDFSGTYQIRYNKRDYGDDPTSLTLYTTLAHEGIPGHMYQTQYDHEHFQYPIEYMLSNMGFAEGYATYVEFQALKFLDLDYNALLAYTLNESYSNFLVAKMDIDINYYGMSLEQFQQEYGYGMDLLYARLCDNPTVFLSYYYGYYEILDLRNQAQEALNAQFDDIEFNNALLSAGQVNFEIIGRNIAAYIEAAGKDLS